LKLKALLKELHPDLDSHFCTFIHIFLFLSSSFVNDSYVYIDAFILLR
jgi:hypothetical protein